MKNYFIAGLAPEKKARLQEAAVAFCDMEIDGASGIVLEEADLTKALGFLNAAVEEERTTSLEGIMRVELHRNVTSNVIPQPPATVIVDGRSEYRCDHWQNFASAIQKWVAEKKVAVREVVLAFCVKGNPVAEELSRQQLDRVVLIVGRSNWGEIIPNVITDGNVEYVPAGQFIRVFGLPECPDQEDVKKTISAFEKFLPLALADKAEVEEIIKKAAAERRRKSRESYVHECSKRFEKTVQGTRESITKGHADIARLQQELSRRIRETHGAERKLEQIEFLRGDQMASYGREFDSLVAVPGVEGVEVADGVIKVLTEHIYITPDGHSTTYDIGKFRMEIYTAGSNGGIRFFNLTRQGRKSGYNSNHPHVDECGVPCLGNIKEMVPQLIGEYEYSAVAQIGLQYLKSVNTNDSAGKGIFEYWPKKEG